MINIETKGFGLRMPSEMSLGQMNYGYLVESYQIEI